MCSHKYLKVRRLCNDNLLLYTPTICIYGMGYELITGCVCVYNMFIYKYIYYIFIKTKMIKFKLLAKKCFRL